MNQASAQPQASGEARAAPDLTSRWRIAALLLVLPLFGQTFHYMKDLSPLWALSKAFPLLALPLAAVLLWHRADRDVLFWLAAFLWLLIVPSITAIFAFDQSFVIGLTAQVKLLGMLYALSFFGFLLVLRPTLGELARAFAIWGGVIAGVLVLLWAFAPQSWYATGYEFGDAPLLSTDDRGNRIRMPMFFALIAMFALYRQVLAGERRWWALMGLALGMALLVLVVKTRAIVLAAAGTLVLVTLIAATPRQRIVAFCLAAIAALGLLQVPYIQSAFDLGAASGFDLRMTTIAKATAFLGDDPLRWLLGVGTISSIDPDGMARWFNHFFFLADISWLGVVFEFGLVGAAIILGLLLRTWWLGRVLRQRIDAPFLGGLQDYVLFVLLISPLYSTMVLQPGEIALIAAIFGYGLMLTREGQLAGGELGDRVPRQSMARNIVHPDG